MSVNVIEDIFINREEKIIVKLSSPFQDKIQIAKSLFGSVPDDFTFEEIREDKIKEL